MNIYIFARNVAMIELIYTVRSYTVWVKIEIVSKSALLGSSLRHVGSDNDAISYVSAGEPCSCLCSVSAWLLCTPTITLYRYAKHHVHVDRQSPVKCLMSLQWEFYDNENYFMNILFLFILYEVNRCRYWLLRFLFNSSIIIASKDPNYHAMLNVE